jgi:hypothetical protein
VVGVYDLVLVFVVVAFAIRVLTLVFVPSMVVYSLFISIYFSLFMSNSLGLILVFLLPFVLIVFTLSSISQSAFVPFSSQSASLPYCASASSYSSS